MMNKTMLMHAHFREQFCMINASENRPLMPHGNTIHKTNEEMENDLMAILKGEKC